MYSHVVLGGTFDHLHTGHLALLSLAFSKGKKVSLGLTKASMNTKKDYADQIQPYALRKKAIIEFAANLGRRSDLRIIPIRDIYGTAHTDPTLEAIIVTKHTRSGADQINEQRISHGLQTLSVEVCDLQMDETGEVLSSSRIRSGVVNRSGHSYAMLFADDMQIHESARQALKRPFGIKTGSVRLKQKPSPIVVIGDIAAQYCMDYDVPFRSAFVDGMSKKQPFLVRLGTSYTQVDSALENSAGYITHAAATFLQTQALQSHQTLYTISGEEDLLTVVCVLLFPFGTRIVYGFPYKPESMRVITINDRIKQRFAAIIGE